MSSLPKTRTFIFNAERLHETRIDTNSLGISSNFSALEERIGKKKKKNRGEGKNVLRKLDSRWILSFLFPPLTFLRGSRGMASATIKIPAPLTVVRLCHPSNFSKRMRVLLCSLKFHSTIRSNFDLRGVKILPVECRTHRKSSSSSFGNSRE